METTEAEEVARAQTPRGEVVLLRRAEAGAAAVLELRVNGVFVMDTRETATERALAREALALLDAPHRVLVGGLGLGFTLAEVLADRRVEACTVVELEDALVGWMRKGTIEDGPALLSDDRVRVLVQDVALTLTQADEGAYDLVLLDVDNGPGHLVHDANRALYTAPLLAAAARATSGALAIWSASESPELGAAMEAVFGNVSATAYDVRLGSRPEHYWLYSSRRMALT